jgi:hypothetical protein
MDFSKTIEQMKPVLREKWLDYYELNHHWIETAKIHRWQNWKEVIDGEETALYCPESTLMLGVITTLDKTANGFLQISTQLTGGYYPDKIIENIGLKFDPTIALKNREESMEKTSDLEEPEVLISEENIDLLTIFTQVKLELRKKWINYYIVNQDWIKLAGLHNKHAWNEVVDEKTVTRYCPHSHLIVGFASGSDKRVAGLINISTQLTETCNLGQIAKGLGLIFDVESVLVERRRIIKERREMQNDKINSTIE